jgi:pimeloyl-ACP methyl ester carboxylesterase
MPFFPTNSATIFYTDSGPPTAPPLLLLHGWTCDSNDWIFQIPFLLSTGYRVIAPDLRGHGASTAPPDSSFFGATFADDILNLLAHLKVPRTIVMAHSMGAKEVAATLATRDPGVVVALVLIDVIYNEIEDRETLDGVIAMFQSAKASDMAAAGMVSELFNVDSTPEWLKTWHGRRALATLDYVVGGCYRDQHVEGEIGLVESARRLMRKREAPWLYVGRDEKGAEVFRGYDGREGDEIVVMDGTGHWLHQERWEEFNGLVLEWLGKRGLLPRV